MTNHSFSPQSTGKPDHGGDPNSRPADAPARSDPRPEQEIVPHSDGNVTSDSRDAPPFRGGAFDADAVWQQLQSEFEIRHLTAYDSWIQDTWVVAYEDGEFIIGLPDAYRRDWLEKKLRTQIKRALSVIMGRSSVDVHFLVRPRPVVDAPNASPAPLYATEGDIGEPEANMPLVIADGGTKPAAIARPVSQRNSRLTFDSFVVGSHNRLAHAAARAVAEHPGSSYNPLFVYGGVGLGKTHLLNAIANHLVSGGHRVVYCTSEQFTNDLIAAIRSQTTDLFREKYRQLDALLIDDIQFISGKDSTQEEFFHTFNHLHTAGKQIVISSDRPPKALATLEERLRNRFEGSIQTDIQMPDFETRVAILQAKAERENIAVPTDVLMMVAERVESNVRELEGTFNNLCMHARLHGDTLTLGLATTILKNLAPRREPCSPEQLIHIVAEHFSLGAEDLVGPRRTASIAHARQVAMYLLREEQKLSLPRIGFYLGNRDHTTVRHGAEKIARDVEHDEQLRRDITLLRERIVRPSVR